MTQTLRKSFNSYLSEGVDQENGLWQWWPWVEYLADADDDIDCNANDKKMRFLRWILVHFPSVRGIPLQPHHLHEQTGDDNEEFVKNYGENNDDFNDAMWKNRWKSKFQIPSATSGCPPAAKARERLEPDSARSKSNDVIFNVADFYPYWGYIWQKMGLKGCFENFQTFIRFGGIVLYDDNVDRIPAWLWEVSNFQKQVGWGTWLW